MPVEFFLRARCVQRARVVRAREGVRLQRTGDHRRMLAGRHRACVRSIARHRHETDRGRRVPARRWSEAGVAVRKPAGLCRALRIDHAWTAGVEKRHVPAHPRRPGRRLAGHAGLVDTRAAARHRARALDAFHLRRARVAGGGTASRPRRRGAPARTAGARPRTGVAIAGQRRRAHACASPAGAAAHAHCNPSSCPHCRSRRADLPQRRTPPAPTRGTGGDLSRDTAAGKRAHRRTLHVPAGRTGIPLPEGTGAARSHAHQLAAPACRAGHALALAARCQRQGAPADR